MIRCRGIAVLISLLFLFSAAPIHRAGECAYGSVHAWFRTTEGDWEDATAHPMLKRGESFDIKITVITKTDLRVVYLKLHEFGTPVYEVLTGPSTMEQLLDHWGLTQSDQSWTYVWKMRVGVNTSWVNGNSPLEVYVQFTKNDQDDLSVTFDVMNAFIIDELWEQYSPEASNKNVSLQQKDHPRLTSLSIFGVIIVLALVAVFLRRRRQRNNFF